MRFRALVSVKMRTQYGKIGDKKNKIRVKYDKYIEKHIERELRAIHFIRFVCSAKMSEKYPTAIA